MVLFHCRSKTGIIFSEGSHVICLRAAYLQLVLVRDSFVNDMKNRLVEAGSSHAVV